MKSPDGRTKSVWYDTAAVPEYPQPPAGQTRTDVLIVGAGIAGLTTAYLLASEGRDVIVVDEGPILSGQTSRTTAHLTSVSDDRFLELEKQHGVEGSQLFYRSHSGAINLIEKIVRDENIDCDFRRLEGYLFSLPTDPPGLLDDELEAAKRAGFPEVQKLIKSGLYGFESETCLRFANQGRFQPLKYFAGVAQAITRRGGKICTGRRVTDAQPPLRPGEPATAKIDQEYATVLADAIVVATNAPGPIMWIGIHTKQAAYRTFVIGAKIPRGAVTDALYWNTGDPYHYIRLEGARERDGQDILIIGGEDHKTAQPPHGVDPFANLERWARQKFPVIGEIVYRWSGQVQEPDDYAAFIGPVPKMQGVYVITGDSGMGMTHGTIGGRLVSDLIQGRSNDWLRLYDPSRKELNRDFVKENLNVAVQFKDYVTPGEIKSESDLRPGQGAVVREGLHKLAVYRDDSGAVHKHSAVCTHMGCVVRWNEIEGTFDCPCHGSRFDPHGKVITAPAISDLSDPSM